MIDTSRIRSGFDAELMLGGRWFFTAMKSLEENGLLTLPTGTTITDVTVIMEDDWDLAIVVSGVFTVKAKMEIANGQFLFTSDFNNTSFAIDLPSFGQLDQPPVLQKVAGDADHENAMALLLNLALKANPQDEEPSPDGEPLERGIAEDAVSFLPLGQHIALGLGSAAFQRFANNIWHTSLRAPDGSHPLPDAENKKGDWKRVKVSLNGNRIKFTLEGEVPIDLWPDADVTLEIKVVPRLSDGKLAFALDLDLDIDTGLWGDILVFTIGALIGLIIGLFTGGIGFLIPSVGLGTVVLLEIVEYAVGEVIERNLLVRDENGRALVSLVADGGIVKFATPKPPENALSIGFMDAIPSSIPIFNDQSDILFNHLLVVQAQFDDLAMNSDGLAVAGTSLPSEMFEPIPAMISSSGYEESELKTLTYRILSSSEEVTLDLQEVLDRLRQGELAPPVKLTTSLEDPVVRIPAGKLSCPVLIPTRIQRKDTIIRRIRFSGGLELNTADAVMLQDSAGVVLQGLQLIHPRNAKAYFRAPANDSESDNFEALPEI